MTWVDVVVLGVLALSGVLAFARGLVREVLGIGAWVGAAFVTAWAFPLAQPQFRQWFSNPEIADPATVIVVFLASLVALSLVSHWIGALVSLSSLGGLDRTLGLVFGIARGAAVVVFAYIAVGLAIPIDRWPDPVLEARSLPFAYDGALWLVGQLPAEYRPRLYPPPLGRQTSAADLLRAMPQGRAIGSPARD